MYALHGRTLRGRSPMRKASTTLLDTGGRGVRYCEESFPAEDSRSEERCPAEDSRTYVAHRSDTQGQQLSLVPSQIQISFGKGIGIPNTPLRDVVFIVSVVYE